MNGKITKRSVDAVLPTDTDQFLWDTELRGFGLKVTAKGRKLYLPDYRTKGGRRRGYTLPAAHGAPWTPDSARKEVRTILGDVAHGGDPVEERSQGRKAETISELTERFMREHVRARRKSRTVHDYGRLIDKHLVPAIGRREVVDLTRLDVARLHSSLHHAPRRANQVLAVLSKMMNLAEAWGLRADGTNPCRHIERNSENHRQRFLSELARLWIVPADAERNGHVLLPATKGRPERPAQIPSQVIPAVRLLASDCDWCACQKFYRRNPRVWARKDQGPGIYT